MERRGFCLFAMEKKKLLHYVILLILLGSDAVATELDDLIKSQDKIVKQHMQDLTEFMLGAHDNAARSKLSAQALIENINTHYHRDLNLPWLDDLKAIELPNLNVQQELYVFVSLSIPKTRLIEILKEANNYNGVVVLRGLKNNSYKETAIFLQAIIKKSSNGVIIDPTLFEKYNITQVPVFVLNDPNNNNYDQITGNISLKHALQTFAKDGDLKAAAGKILRAKR